MTTSPTAWGHPTRYYADESPPAQSTDALFSQDTDLWRRELERSVPDARGIVERAYKRWNHRVHDLLRNETALRLSSEDHSQSVPIKVVDGVPLPIADVLRGLTDYAWLILNRPLLLAAVNGTRFMSDYFAESQRVFTDRAGPASRQEIDRVRETAEAWLHELDRIRAIERAIHFREDVLGAYFFKVPEIHLYWTVIGIVARMLGVSIEALTVVVLAHELAHAYTHLGRDIDGACWETTWFAQTDLDIVEGLAQFYTEEVCHPLDGSLPAAHGAYSALLEKQSPPYRAHRQWVGDYEKGGEIVRAGMIECRHINMIRSEDFAEAVHRKRKELDGGDIPF
jgi:hypothetical protein